MKHTDTVLAFIRDYKDKMGYEPEITTIHKETGVSRVNIYQSFVELKQSGEIEEITPNRSSQYSLSTG